jgi:predicted nucleotidyltransferase component of viral defense system
MLLPEIIRSLAIKNQTTELNIRREYVQHLFLSYFYRLPQSHGIYFKGGTALRIAFSSPRFSEDLDFSASLYNGKAIEKVIINTLKEIHREGITTDILESKETSGGYLADIDFSLGDDRVRVLLQLSKSTKTDTGEIITVSNDFMPAFTISILNRRQLFAEKIQAAIIRSKPRDFYDIYFLIRSGFLHREDKEMLAQVTSQLSVSSINFERELKLFLPKSHWPIIRDFRKNLMQELERFT